MKSCHGAKSPESTPKRPSLAAVKLLKIDLQLIPLYNPKGPDTSLLKNQGLKAIYVMAIRTYLTPQ